MRRRWLLLRSCVCIGWIAGLLALPVRAGPESAAQADRVKVYKSERKLLLLRRGRILRQYAIALGQNPEGHKRESGDGRTPEGRYVLDWRSDESRFYRAIHVSYPNGADVLQARERRVDPGGAIMIHGLPNGLGLIGSAHRFFDWTDGCIAVTNEEMDEIWERVPDGTTIEIWP